MSVHNLDKLFKPASIAVVGASNRPGTLGGLVMRNLLQCGFSGPIMPVKPGLPAGVAGGVGAGVAEGLSVAAEQAVVPDKVQ